MSKLYLFLCLLCVNVTFSKDMDFELLSTQIQENNKNGEYKASLISLYQIIHSPKTTYRDKSNAYFLKAKMLRQLGSYPEAIANMELAYKYAEKTKQTQHLDNVFLFEIAMIYCEQAKYVKALEILTKVDISQSNWPFQSRTNGIWLYLKAIQESQAHQYEKAIDYLNQAIAILQMAEPMYLVVAHKELLRNYIALGKSSEIELLYPKIIELASHYQWKSQVLQTHRIMALYYKDKGEFEQSLAISKLEVVTATAFNTVNISSNLNLLERQLLEEDAKAQRTKETRLAILLFIALVGLIILVYFLMKRRSKNIANKNYWIEKNLELEASIYQLNKKSTQNSLPPAKLSKRQKSIIELVKKGKTNKEIAHSLNISVNTVKYHLKIIYAILGVKNRKEI